MRISDWSSDVVSSDLETGPPRCRRPRGRARLDPPSSTRSLRTAGRATDALRLGETRLNAADRTDSTRPGPRVPLRDHVPTSIRRSPGHTNGKIGRASGRERGGSYVKIQVVAVT